MSEREKMTPSPQQKEQNMGDEKVLSESVGMTIDGQWCSIADMVQAVRQQRAATAGVIDADTLRKVREALEKIENDPPISEAACIATGAAK